MRGINVIIIIIIIIYLHLCTSVTKQYNLVPVKQRLHTEAGKVTVGLVTHCPSSDFVVYQPAGSRPVMEIKDVIEPAKICISWMQISDAKSINQCTVIQTYFESSTI